MRPFNKKPQITSAEFSAALREAGFAVDHGRILDVSGNCLGFTTMPSFNIRWERDAEIRRRAVSALVEAKM
jgi:hypothetical protein